jgi:hypothetical protein
MKGTTMATWKPASVVFQGGTQQVVALSGKRVRSRASLMQVPIHDALNATHRTLDVPIGTLGLVANPVKDEILIALPKVHGTSLTTLDALMRANAFHVIRVNWPTFRMQFEIEA